MADELPLVNPHTAVILIMVTVVTSAKNVNVDNSVTQEDSRVEPAGEADEDISAWGLSRPREASISRHNSSLFTARTGREVGRSSFTYQRRRSISPISSICCDEGDGGGGGADLDTSRRGRQSTLPRESADINPLSVVMPLALAAGDERCSHDRSLTPPKRHRRSKSMPDTTSNEAEWGLPMLDEAVGISRNGHVGRSGPQDAVDIEERGRRSKTQVDDQNDGNEMEMHDRKRQHSMQAAFVKHGVIRPHRHHRRTPSIVNFFNSLSNLQVAPEPTSSPDEAEPPKRDDSFTGTSMITPQPSGPTGSTSRTGPGREDGGDERLTEERGLIMGKDDGDTAGGEGYGGGGHRQGESDAVSNPTTPSSREAGLLLGENKSYCLTATFEEMEHGDREGSGTSPRRVAAAAESTPRLAEKLGFSRRYGHVFGSGMNTVRRSSRVKGLELKVEHRDAPGAHQVRGFLRHPHPILAECTRSVRYAV